MKQIQRITLTVGNTLAWGTPDVHARPILLRAHEGTPGWPIIFVEHDPMPARPGWLALTFAVIQSDFAYPDDQFRYFSSCLNEDGTDMWHGLYKVNSTSQASRMTQPELPGPPGPQGAMGPPSVMPGPISVTWSTET